MYEKHPSFQDPSDLGTVIWRYMDFTKFVSLLEQRSLFFVRSDKLEDPLEGTYPEGNERQIEDSIRKLPAVLQKRARDNWAKSKEAPSMKPFVLINSWHMNEYESAAMWKLYLKSDEGVAIRSQFSALCSAFEGCTNFPVFVGCVKYLDYETESIVGANLFDPYLIKRKSFEYETEVRVVVWELLDRQIDRKWPYEPPETGIYVPVTLETLIETVVVAPTAPAWFRELVEAVMAKYRLKKEVRQSELARIK